MFFKSSPCMFCKALLIPKNSRMSRSLFCDASRILTLISSTKDERSSRGILSISISVGNSCLSLAAALKVTSNADGVSPKLKTLFMTFNPPDISLYVFTAKNPPVRLLVRDCQWISPSELPVFDFFFYHKSIYISKAWVTCHI